MKNGELIGEALYTNFLFKIVFTTNGQRTVSFSRDGCLQVWNIELMDGSSQAAAVHEKDRVFMISLSDDGKRVLALTFDCRLVFAECSGRR